MKKSILLLPFLALSFAIAAESDAIKPDIFGAIYANNMRMLEKFVAEDPACLNRATKTGLLPIHYAALRNNMEALHKLAKLGADPNALTAGNKKMSGLHVASLQNGEDAVRWFLDRKVDVNFRDGNGANALHYAAKCKGDSSRIIRRLIKAGCDIAATDNEGNTPLHIAALYGTKDTIKALLSAKADPSIRNKAGDVPGDMALDEGIRELFPVIPRPAEVPSVTTLAQKPAPTPAPEPKVAPEPAQETKAAAAPAVEEPATSAEPEPATEEVPSEEEAVPEPEPVPETEGAAQNVARAAALLEDESMPQTERLGAFLEIPGSRPMPDGTFFNGTIKKGRFEGYGILLGRDNGRERYVGWFHNGRKSGHGVYRYANGDTLEAEWKDDAPNGAGTFTFANGCVINGTWKNGLFWSGEGQYRLGKDQLHRGIWSNGELSYSEPVAQ